MSLSQKVQYLCRLYKKCKKIIGGLINPISIFGDYDYLGKFSISYHLLPRT